MKSLVIFDLDGTLLNTISDLGNSCNYALKCMGYPEHALSSYPFMVGNGVKALIMRAQVDAQDEKVLNALLGRFREHYDEHNCDLTTPYKGIEALLRELVKRGVAVAVASNKYQAAVEKIVKHYFPDVPFVAVCGQVEERPVKPDPSIVFSILSQHPTPKREVLYVGDSAVDMETAHRAGVECIGVTWGFRPVSELRKAAADHIASLPSDILKHLEDPF
jgi:phosphoglycolate phosphatase